jgi:hypothetical protein
MPFRPIVFGQVNVFARPVLQLMNPLPFSGLNSAMGTSSLYFMPYPPLLSAQSLKLPAGDFTTFHSTANPAKLFFLTLGIPSPCPGKA